MELSGGELRIGRATDCAIRTDDGMVSRHHARIYWGGGQYFLEDLGSANGVFYQEQRVARHPLKHGDAVRCGSLWLRFVDPPAAHHVPQPAYPVHAGAQPVPQSGGVPAPHAIPQVGGQPSGHMGGQPGSQPVARPQTSYPATGQQAAVPGYRPATGQQPALPAEPQAAAEPARSEADAEEIRFLTRRIEQLQTELRLYRKGKGEEIAKNIERLQEKNAALESERNQLKTRVGELETTIEQEGSDAKSRRADTLFTKTVETVQQLNDLLSNLRINVMAAEGEFEQFAHEIPRASFELIREALRSSSKDVDTARELLRELRNIAG